MILCYSGRSAPSAFAISNASEDLSIDHYRAIEVVRGSEGDINWGRYKANTKLNPDISNSTNKRKMRELFKEHGVPMPRLMSTEEMNNILSWGNGVIDPIVGRPDSHTKGRGFWLCKSGEALAKALKGTKKKKPATHFMEFVEADHEYRVHIFKGRSIRISEKEFDEDRDYITVKPSCSPEMRKKIRKAAKRAVKALGLDFGAVDVLATDDEVWVLEVNAAPGLGGTMPQVYAEVFKRWKEKASE